MSDSCFPIATDLNQCDGSVFNSNFDFEAEALIGNRADILSITRNSSNPTIIEAITLKTGKKMYKLGFRETKPMNDLAETTEEKSFGKTYKVEGELIVYGRDPASAYQKLLLDNGKHFIMLKQASKAGTSSYRIFLGIESGLKPAAGETFNKEKGGYPYKFMEDFLSYPQNYLWLTNEATTAAIEAELQIA